MLVLAIDEKHLSIWQLLFSVSRIVHQYFQQPTYYFFPNIISRVLIFLFNLIDVIYEIKPLEKRHFVHTDLIFCFFFLFHTESFGWKCWMNKWYTIYIVKRSLAESWADRFADSSTNLQSTNFRALWAFCMSKLACTQAPYSFQVYACVSGRNACCSWWSVTMKKLIVQVLLGYYFLSLYLSYHYQTNLIQLGEKITGWLMDQMSSWVRTW